MTTSARSCAGIARTRRGYPRYVGGESLRAASFFSTPYTDDPLNLGGVREGCEQLFAASSDVAFEVPAADPAATEGVIRAVLSERGLLVTGV